MLLNISFAFIVLTNNNIFGENLWLKNFVTPNIENDISKIMWSIFTTETDQTTADLRVP